MKTKFSLHSFFRKEILWVILLSLFIGVWFLAATWDMVYWPTDTEVYYLEAARTLSHLQYISQMHDNFDQAYFRFLHGKEFYILTVSWVQQLMRDTETLRPFLLVCIFSITLSGIFIFLISRRLWGGVPAWFCYLFFVACFWPYQQILYTGHLPQGLLFFLLAVSAILFSQGRWQGMGCLIAGIFMGLSFFSSPVSALYVPLLAAVFFGRMGKDAPASPRRRGRQMMGEILFGAGGFLLALTYFNYPNIVENFRKYFEFVDISSSHTHFFYNQPILIQWISHPENAIRGGWIWVWKYFLWIMPVLFPVFCAAMGYLLWRSWAGRDRKRLWFYLVVILLAWSAPILAEVKAVAQIGRSYFPSLIGMLVLVGFAISIFQRETWPGLSVPSRRRVTAFAALVLASHAAWNFFVFFTDVYPSRMGVTFLTREIARRGIREIYTYPWHPHRGGTVDCLPPSLLKKLQFIRMNSVAQPRSGVILVPPVSGDSIYLAAHSSFDDFDRDLFLNELFRKGVIAQYAVASYPTLVSSRIWPLEEEILAYKNLMLGHRMDDPLKTRVWLLDAATIHRDLARNLPSVDEIGMMEQGIRDIGTREPRHRFKGMMKVVATPQSLAGIPLRIFKVGEPSDGLVAYLYKVSPEEKLWIPFDREFASQVVAAREITSSSDGGAVFFPFANSKALAPGRYFIVVYRTGAPDNKNFYRIYLNP